MHETKYGRLYELVAMKIPSMLSYNSPGRYFTRKSPPWGIRPGKLETQDYLFVLLSFSHSGSPISRLRKRNICHQSIRVLTSPKNTVVANLATGERMTAMKQNPTMTCRENGITRTQHVPCTSWNLRSCHERNHEPTKRKYGTVIVTRIWREGDEDA